MSWELKRSSAPRKTATSRNKVGLEPLETPGADAYFTQDPMYNDAAYARNGDQPDWLGRGQRRGNDDNPSDALGSSDSPVRDFTMEEVCKYIRAHRRLDTGTIVSTECYKSTGAVTHRFLLVEIAREGKGATWLRLDRRTHKGSSFFHFSGPGVKPAGDTGQLCSVKSQLLDSKHEVRENRQIFSKPPSVVQLYRILKDIPKEFENYNLLEANCWFLCSVLQEHFARKLTGYFVEGYLPAADHAIKLREWVLEKWSNMPPLNFGVSVRNDPMPIWYGISPNVHATLCWILGLYPATQSVSDIQAHASACLALFSQCPTFQAPVSKDIQAWGHELIQHLVPVREYLTSCASHPAAIDVAHDRVRLQRCISAGASADDQITLMDALSDLERALEACGRNMEGMAVRQESGWIYSMAKDGLSKEARKRLRLD